MPVSSLSGKRVVITRDENQSYEFKTSLTNKGAVPLLYPCIKIQVEKFVAPQIDFDWVIFTSQNAVDAVIHSYPDGYLRAKFGAMGSKTALRINHLFNKQAFPIPNGNLAGQRIFLPQGNLARSDIRNALISCGAEVTCLQVYRTMKGSGGIDLRVLVNDNAIDALTFASSSAATFFIERFLEESGDFEKLAKIPIVCIGEPTKKTAMCLGFHVSAVANEQSVTGLIKVLEDYF